MSLQEIVAMIHNGEYGKAISSLEHAFKGQMLTLRQKPEYCKWLAECNQRLGEAGEAGNWCVESVRIVLSQRIGGRAKARLALPLCAKALEGYEKGGDPADVLVAARLKQYLVGLSK